MLDESVACHQTLLSMTVEEQSFALIPFFKLESGIELRNVQVAFKTWGALSATKDNVIVVCHAFSGHADVSQWWGEVLGAGDGRAFDTEKYFIVCLNVLGSPYGTTSPMTYRDGRTRMGCYGPDFPRTTIRDDVMLHMIVLQMLGIEGVASVVGGSMGGMLALEWALLGKSYVRSIVAIATSARQHAWALSWSEVQRQSIFSDEKYKGGRYSPFDAPCSGLAAARMAALMTYRTPSSFNRRFGRDPANVGLVNRVAGQERVVRPARTDIVSSHNEGLLSSRLAQRPMLTPPDSPRTMPPEHCEEKINSDGQSVASSESNIPFAAQSYLWYQADRFSQRFDANCYLSLTRKVDSHDITRGRVAPSYSDDRVKYVLNQVEQATLVICVDSDGLYGFNEQKEIALGIPGSQLRVLHSDEGHDAFLLESRQLNQWIGEFLSENAL